MGRLPLLLLSGLVLLVGCQGPRTRPAAPRATFRIVFTDGRAELGFDQDPPQGAWMWMDAGLWSPLALRWEGQSKAEAEVPRTAPDWLVLKDPAGGIHRLVLHDRPDPVPMPEPGRLMHPGHLDEEDRVGLAMLGVIWVLSFTRR